MSQLIPEYKMTHCFHCDSPLLTTQSVAMPYKPSANCARICRASESDGPLAQLVEQLTLNQ